ncbi:ATP-binding cassette domain-containing protein, partial [Brachybacterium alimentarium]
DRNERRRRMLEALEQARVPEPEKRAAQYPHQLSGGLRQRVMIAMALMSRPRLLIADEPTTALDVTTQAEILDLLRTLQVETGMGILLITHDLGVVASVADRVAVLHDGVLVEQGEVLQVFEEPRADYTRGLLAATPRLEIGAPA